MSRYRIKCRLRLQDLPLRGVLRDNLLRLAEQLLAALEDSLIRRFLAHKDHLVVDFAQKLELHREIVRPSVHHVARQRGEPDFLVAEHADRAEGKLAVEYGVSRIPVRFAVQKLSGEGWLVPDDRRRLRVKDITRKSIEDIYSFREIMETRSLPKIFEAIRNKDYDTAYFYLKRDHFDHSIGGRSVADLVEQRLQTLRAAEKSKKK